MTGDGVRSGGKGDAAAISRLLERTMRDAWSAEMVAETLVHEGLAFVSESASAGEVEGAVLVRGSSCEAEILQLAVDPSRRRQGLGIRLLREALAAITRAGAHVAWLEVRTSNLEARRLYQRAGFLEVGSRPRYYRNGEDAVLMRKQLAFASPGGEPETS